jgi:WD40 repeat protein/tRNA A-37 threonylcarbamoyl transferase component Bud32
MFLFCRECGFKNKEGSNFCRSCGANLSAGATSKLFVLDDRYLIQNVLKTGGMGSVYKAEDTRLGGSVAIKKMLVESEKPEKKIYAARRFREEARILFNLHHNGLPKVTDFFVAEDPETGTIAHYLVMTFIKGLDLETIMEKRGYKPLPIEEVADYFVKILDILAYMHSRKPPVIYRDMKPSNVMVTNDDPPGVFLIDFGIAKQPVDVKVGTRVGTKGYAAPEQYQGLADQRTDIFSLGATIHYLLTGIDPQDSSSSPFAFQPIRSVNPDVPARFEEIISKMLDINVTRRPQSAEEVLKMVESLSKKPGVFLAEDLPASPALPPAPVFAGGLAPVKSKPLTISRAEWQHVKTMKGQSGSILDVAFTPDGRFLASASEDFTVRIWNVQAGIPVASLEEHEGIVRCVAFSPDGSILASGSDDMTVRLWDWKHSELISTFSDCNVPILSIIYAKDGRSLLTGTLGNSLCLWDAKTGKIILNMDRHYSSVNWADFARDGQIISGSSDRTVRIWHPMTGKQLNIFEKHTSAVRCVANSPDGSLVASASDDKTICLWSMVQMALAATLEGHNEGVTSVSFSGDGRTLASASDDKSVRLWDVRGARLSNILRGHTAWVKRVLFSPDGQYLASASADRTIRLWQEK